MRRDGTRLSAALKVVSVSYFLGDVEEQDGILVAQSTFQIYYFFLASLNSKNMKYFGFTCRFAITGLLSVLNYICYNLHRNPN
jgi:hypothetical protein